MLAFQICRCSMPSSMLPNPVASGGRCLLGLADRRTVYTRMNRWAKPRRARQDIRNRLQREQIVRVKLEAVSMDSTIVKVHSDGTGALKKTDLSPSASPGVDSDH